ncbi:MAG: hypothetical protein J07HR59_01382 [Halorubrum sp. J07HR59]|nr:MAG: hypothetical protein J07HR59_01382 [Halorubrum sp. J07HR59]
MTTHTVSEDSEFAGRIRVARRGVASNQKSPVIYYLLQIY